MRPLFESELEPFIVYVYGRYQTYALLLCEQGARFHARGVSSYHYTAVPKHGDSRVQGSGSAVGPSRIHTLDWVPTQPPTSAFHAVRS